MQFGLKNENYLILKMTVIYHSLCVSLEEKRRISNTKKNTEGEMVSVSAFQRQLWGILIVLLIIVVYTTLPASHRIITDPHHGIVRPRSASLSRARAGTSSPDSDRSSAVDDHRHDAVVTAVAAVGKTVAHQQQSDDNDDVVRADGNNPVDASTSKHDHCSSSRRNSRSAAMQARFPQMEPTEICDEKHVYSNPYRPLKESSRPCANLKYTRGRWVRREQPPKPVYPALGEILGCCERGFKSRNISSSSMMMSSLSGSSFSSASSSFSSAAAAAPLSSSSTALPLLRPELLYEWVPDECDLIPWSEEMFCKALRGRDIMFAGDSLNDHWHASLYYLLGGRKDIYKREGTISGKHRCHGHAICAKYYPKPLKLMHLTNQLLDEKRLINRNYKWWRPIGEFPVLVLNSGSWMRDPADETRVVSDERWQDLMVKALGLVRRQHYNGTIIWRTTYSGHPWCWRHSKPLEEPLSPEQLNPHVAPYDKYRWEFISKRNAFTTKLWRDRAGAHILDVERLTNLMPLGHLGQNHPKFATRNATDCLHYCSPGPVYDTWSELLMNLLLGNL